jgi:hypothetical protein
VWIPGRQLDHKAAPDTTEELEQADRLSLTGSGLLLTAAGKLQVRRQLTGVDADLEVRGCEEEEVAR